MANEKMTPPASSASREAGPRLAEEQRPSPAVEDLQRRVETLTHDYDAIVGRVIALEAWLPSEDAAGALRDRVRAFLADLAAAHVAMPTVLLDEAKALREALQ